MDRLLIDYSKIEDGASFSAGCERLGIQHMSAVVEGFAVLKLPDKYKKTNDSELDAYVMRTLASFTDVFRCQ